MRYLGIDYGTKKIGLALSDEAETMGFPHTTLPNTPKLLDELGALIAEKNIGAVVIGESHNLSGGENPVMGDIKTLAEALTKHTGIAVVFEPEVFTSVEARRLPHKKERSRSKKGTISIDASAAALILTSYLSRTHHE